jgi:HEAT repeat protein
MEKQIESKSSSRSAMVKKVIIYGFLICFTFLFVAYLLICFDINSSVKEISADAIQQYPGDRIEALITYVDSENKSLMQRNRAVWALGQIGDQRALPILTASYTGGPCDHDSRLCQGEIQKAIKLCEGSFNATAWLSR